MYKKLSDTLLLYFSSVQPDNLVICLDSVLVYEIWKDVPHVGFVVQPMQLRNQITVLPAVVDELSITHPESFSGQGRQIARSSE